MKTLDRYIIRTFLINFAILFVVMMSLFVVVDLIVDLDEFLKAGRVYAQEWGNVVFGTIYAIADYYGPLIVLIYVFFSGLLVVAAMGFTLSAMQRSRELTAMLASGISAYRIAAPVLVVGIALNALALPLQEFVIPEVAGKLARPKSQVEHEAIADFPIHYAVGEHGTLLSASKFDAKKGLLNGVTILERNAQGMIHRLITASHAVWEPKRGGWRLFDGYAASPNDEGLAYGKPDPIRFYATELSPTILLARRAAIYSRLLPMRQLQRMQHSDAVDATQKAQITKIIWSRFSMLVMSVLVLVMGLPFFLSRIPGNSLVQGLKAAGVCMSAWGGGLIMLQMSASFINPVAAAWLPVVIYLPVSALLLQLVKT